MSDWPVGPRYLTALPANETHGMEIYLLVDAANGVAWHMIYDGTLSKWIYLGGGPLTSEIATSETTTSTTYVDLTTTGPSVTVPSLGLYAITFGAGCGSTGAAQIIVRVSVDISGSGAQTAEEFVTQAATSGGSVAAEMGPIKRTITSTTIKMQYKTTSQTGTFARRWLSVEPIAINPV